MISQALSIRESTVARHFSDNVKGIFGFEQTVSCTKNGSTTML
nr:hypothetical protein [Vibrio parahaemolyticus]